MSRGKRKWRLKRKIVRGLVLALKWSVVMALFGLSLFFFMNMVYNQGLKVETHGLVLDLEEEVEASDFVTAYDDTPITVIFEELPIRQEGRQKVVLIVENSKGRSRRYTEYLEFVRKDLTPPVISGVKDIYVLEGETIAYLDGVRAEDDRDGEVAVTVEKASVNTRAAGIYPITYLATDSAGNLAKVTAVVTVGELTATQKQLYDLADRVLAKITTNNMSLGQKAQAIFNYVYNNTNYTGTRLGSDWDTEGYAGLTNIESTGMTGGDCHTYYAMANVLLLRAGAQVMMVERQNAQEGNKHYWILCNVGTGWYHFDATKIEGGYTCFMWTDAQVREFSNIKSNFYDFDANAYPATPTTPFVLE